jgi:hypothetical protein
MLILLDMTNFDFAQKKKITKIAVLITLLFITASIVSLIYGYVKFQYFYLKNNLTDEKNIERYVYEKQVALNDSGINKSYFIPVSVLIEDLIFSEDSYPTLTGYISLKYPKDFNDKDLATGVYFPDSIDEKIDLMKVSKTDKEMHEIYRFAAKLQTSENIKQFPFGLSTLALTMQPKAIGPEVILIPDLSYYSYSLPIDLPGIDKTIDSSNITILRSYYHVSKGGFLINKKEANQLIFSTFSYNIDYVKNALNVFIIYFLPLLVIVVITFSVIWMVVYGEFDSLQTSLGVSGAYTALTFALIITHTALRTKFETSSIIYLEALFFPVYLIIILLLVHSMYLVYQATVKGQKYSTEVQLINKEVVFLFWPLITFSWFLITYIFFF